MVTKMCVTNIRLTSKKVINLKTSLSGQNNLGQIQMGDSLMIKDSFVNSDWLTIYPSTRRYNFSWRYNNWFIGYRSGFSLMSKINIIVSSPGLKYRGQIRVIFRSHARLWSKTLKGPKVVFRSRILA